MNDSQVKGTSALRSCFTIFLCRSILIFRTISKSSLVSMELMDKQGFFSANCCHLLSCQLRNWKILRIYSFWSLRLKFSSNLWWSFFKDMKSLSLILSNSRKYHVKFFQQNQWAAKICSEISSMELLVTSVTCSPFILRNICDLYVKKWKEKRL